jgi:hypothetical protein
VSCSQTATQIAAAFNANNYNAATFNAGDFVNKLSVIGIKFMGQFSDCKTTEFLFAIDNRLSDLSFLAGLGSNLVT